MSLTPLATVEAANARIRTDMRHDRPRARSAPNFALWPSYEPRCLGKDEVRSGRTVNPDSASEEHNRVLGPNTGTKASFPALRIMFYFERSRDSRINHRVGSASLLLLYARSGP
jgi:hypothetical protein